MFSINFIIDDFVSIMIIAFEVIANRGVTVSPMFD